MILCWWESHNSLCMCPLVVRLTIQKKKGDDAKSPIWVTDILRMILLYSGDLQTEGRWGSYNKRIILDLLAWRVLFSISRSELKSSANFWSSLHQKGAFFFFFPNFSFQQCSGFQLKWMKDERMFAEAGASGENFLELPSVHSNQIWKLCWGARCIKFVCFQFCCRKVPLFTHKCLHYWPYSSFKPGHFYIVETGNYSISDSLSPTVSLGVVSVVTHKVVKHCFRQYY